MESQEMVPNHGQQGSHPQMILLPAVSAKPRLKWTRQLHEHFVDAVSQLGGADKATPKSVMRIMGIPGLTLHHLKSHLQKYRLARSRDSSMLNGEQDINCGAGLKDTTIHDEEQSGTQPDYNENMLKMQIEVQRKLHEQTEVQKHLQLRIEAQGKYLQTVLKKAQETLAEYSLNTTGFDAAKSELSELVSAVETAECLSSSSSQDGIFVMKRTPGGDCSTESCLTTSDPPELKVAASHRQECSSNALNLNEDCDEINMDGRKRAQLVGANELCSKRNCCIETNNAEHLKEHDNSGDEPEEIDLNR